MRLSFLSTFLGLIVLLLRADAGPIQQQHLAVLAASGAAIVEVAQGSVALASDAAVGTLTVQDVDSTGSNRVFVVGITSEDDITGISCTYDGSSVTFTNSYTIISNTLTEVNVLVKAGIPTCTGATCDTVCTWSPTRKAAMSVRTYTGVEQVTPVNSSSLTPGGPDDGPATTTTVSTPVGDLVIDVCNRWSNAQTPVTVGTGQTQDFNFVSFPTGSSHHHHLASSKPAGGSVVTSWTWTAGTDREWACIGLSLDRAAS
jgi:hypothetical protein